VVSDEPKSAAERKADLFVVDEAAGIPLPALKELAGKTPVVFSTTVHGYEGAGRTFTLRFLPLLGKHGSASMSEPVRYASGDPVEEWLFDSFLLDAEPEDLDGLGELSAESPDPKELFADEPLLRSVFGLLVSAHYKNSPNDLQTLADAPHHFVQLTKSGGRTVGVVQFAYEGGTDPGDKSEGNLVPSVVQRHYGMEEFTQLKGARVVRIVAHPSFQGKGVGSFSLSSLRPKVDWLGTNFGASARLVRFWANNGYLPVTLGPYRNPTSGEYSVTFIKPLSPAAGKLCAPMAQEFARSFIGSLADVYWDMEPDVALEILKCFKFDTAPELGELESGRLKLFLEGKHVYELDADVAAKLARAYFMSGGGFLSREEELALVSKVLQKAVWKTVKEKTGIEEVFEKVRDAAGKIHKNLF
jgi:tRNA(Met) cytidine acetyltransferase